jgi:hypothetical protein
MFPATGQAGTGRRFEVRTGDLRVGGHLVILAVSDNLGATTTRAGMLWVLPPKGQPPRSDTGYHSSKPMTEEELKKIESGEGKPPEPKDDGFKPPPGAKPLPHEERPSRPK